jgi:hypothetical protein
VGEGYHQRVRVLVLLGAVMMMNFDSFRIFSGRWWGSTMSNGTIGDMQRRVGPVARSVEHGTGCALTRSKRKRLLRFYPLTTTPIVILPSVFQLCNFTSYVLKMKQKFTPTPLCGVNDVKYNVKRKNALIILPLVLVFVCDFTSA